MSRSESRVLHLLSQRPSRTGSGITLDCLVREASSAGWSQHVLAGVPADDEAVQVGELPSQDLSLLRFGTPELPFPVPGMSDVMPYPSTRFSSMSTDQLERYRGAFARTLSQAVDRFQPHVIHVHHLWILASLVHQHAPGVPVVNHCHATGLRQMQLCPGLAEQVRQGCARNTAFLALHEDQASQIQEALGVARERVQVVGAGYREDLFHCPPASEGAAPPRAPVIAYAGKLAHAKGLPSLLDAFERVRAAEPAARLLLAGPVAGEEGQELARRAEQMPGVELLGNQTPAQLGEHLRTARVFTLPSMYEGLPLVLVEAAACGCRTVATALPGVVRALAPVLGDSLRLVDRPALQDVDQLDPTAAPAFVEDLAAALLESLRAPALAQPPDLAAFTWAAVFRRVEAVWNRVRAEGPAYEA